MGNITKLSDKKWFQKLMNNPRKFFMYSMIFLSVSFVGSLIQGIFYPSKTMFTINPPVLYSKSEVVKNGIENKDKEMEKIVNELKKLKIKRDEQTLEKQDSVRIEYLLNAYQKLNNGH